MVEHNQGFDPTKLNAEELWAWTMRQPEPSPEQVEEVRGSLLDWLRGAPAR
ncbi:hypothetical protein HYU96_01405 [Candidatus Daviesbacteria bacterium]|nr:hypothetical protein [Candidatus Daviesbacteria bacterium]